MRFLQLLSIIIFLSLLVIPTQASDNTLRSLPIPIDGIPFWTASEVNMTTVGMVWRDMNKDGFVDVVFSNGHEVDGVPNVMYLSIDGILPSSATWQSVNSNNSGRCAVGDIDDDGYADLVVSGYRGPLNFEDRDHVQVYYNSASGLSTSPGWYSADSMFSFSCALGDVDADGDLDLAVATGRTDGVFIGEHDRVYLNENGTFQDTPTWVAAWETATADVSWGDVNNDGFLDLAVCCDNEAEMVYISQAGVLPTHPTWQSANYEAAHAITFADINSDGWLDLVVAYNRMLGGAGYFAVFYNNGAGQLESTYSWHSTTGGYGTCVAVYDYDSDGDDDLVASRTGDRPRIYENIDGRLTFSPVWQADVVSVVEEVAWVDTDGSDVEHYADTAMADGRRAIYTSRHPLHAIDSIVVDGAPLPYDRYCYDLIAGWVSLDTAPSSESVVYYSYSHACDLAVASRDSMCMLYANKGYVDLYADTVIGWAPLSVHFSDSTPGANSWLYRFGDGDSSLAPEPVHIYESPGIYDVSLANQSDYGLWKETTRNMVSVLADTIYFVPDSVLAGSLLVVSVGIANTHPLNLLTIPIEIDDAPIGLRLDSISFGERTSGFEFLNMVTFSHWGGVYKLTTQLEAFDDSIGATLSPGRGEILRIYLTTDSTALGGLTNGIRPAVTTYPLNVNTPIRDRSYTPAVVPGIISTINVRRSDCTLDGEIDISDVTYLVNYLFVLSVGPPPTLQSGDFNADLAVDISDLTGVVNYLFLEGPPPVSP